MPLVKLFVHASLKKSLPPLTTIQKYMCTVWKTTPETTKLLLFHVTDWTNEDSYQEDIYIDIRAYGKAERTRDIVLENMKTIQQTLYEQHDLISNIRLETYNGEHYYHCPPPAPHSSEK